MKAFEYLQKNIKKEYSFYPGTVISLTTKDAVTPFKLNEKEYCTGRTKIGNQYYNFLKDESSLSPEEFQELAKQIASNL